MHVLIVFTWPKKIAHFSTCTPSHYISYWIQISITHIPNNDICSWLPIGKWDCIWFLSMHVIMHLFTFCMSWNEDQSNMDLVCMYTGMHRCNKCNLWCMNCIDLIFWCRVAYGFTNLVWYKDIIKASSIHHCFCLNQSLTTQTNRSMFYLYVNIYIYIYLCV